MRTGIARLLRNWYGYRCLADWAGVITLAMAAVCDRVCLAINPVSGDLLTLGGGWSTVCGTLNLVCCATGSYLLFVNGTFGGNVEELDFLITTLGSNSWG